MKSEPDWSALPADVPDPIRLLLKRCLEKDRRARVSDIGVARFVLAESLSPEVRAGANSSSFERRALSRRRVFAAGAAGLVAGLAAATLMTWKATRATDSHRHSLAFHVRAPFPADAGLTGANRRIALSPDGSRLVYQSEGTPRGRNWSCVRWTSWSCSRSPELSDAGHSCRRTAVGSDTSQTTNCEKCRFTAARRSQSAKCLRRLCVVRRGPPMARSSSPSPTLGPGCSACLRQAAIRRSLTTPDGAANVNGHAYPFALPGGRSLLFTMASAQPENSQIAVLDLKTKDIKTLLRGGTDAKYVTTGHLVYTSAGSRTGSLRAVRFDLARLEVLGDPVPVVDQCAGRG